jgi:hypothetical protein
MHISEATADLVRSVDTLSQGRLTRRDDLGTLIELAARGNMNPVLDDLSFIAKFVSKTSGIMARIGKEGRGYETLERELGANLQKVVDLLVTLLADAPDDIREAFSGAYCSKTPAALNNLLSLCYDLRWYKNWLIDQ